jgi:hypothetical protein
VGEEVTGVPVLTVAAQVGLHVMGPPDTVPEPVPLT